jgi:hypothetical protein
LSQTPLSLVSWHDAGFAQVENVSLSVSPQLPEIDLTGRSANDISRKAYFKLNARRRSGHPAGTDLLRIERVLYCAFDGPREDEGTLARERDEAPPACAAASRHPLPPAARSSELMAAGGQIHSTALDAADLMASTRITL